MMRPRFETWIPKNWSPDWLLSARSFVVIKGPRSKGFVDRDVDASYPCTVHTEVRDEISAAACDGNIRRLADRGFLGLGRVDGRDERLLA